jgi:pSer/pThr/pTyr-binding forkhead associated (FHA) protein
MKTLTFGRGGVKDGQPVHVDVVLTGDPYISRVHALIRHADVSGGDFLIVDKSSSGSFINGRRVPREQEFAFKSTDEVRFGGTTITLCNYFDIPTPLVGKISAIVADKLAIRVGLEARMVYWADIVYVEASDKGAFVHLENEKIGATMSLAELEVELLAKSNVFFKVHRSYIINSKRVSAVNKTLGEVTLAYRNVTKQIPISRDANIRSGLYRLLGF